MSQLIIDLITPKGIVLEKTAIPEEYTVYQIIQELVENLNLPFFASERTVEYSLRWMNHNAPLDPQQTLVEAGVGQGDQLKLESSIPVEEPSVDGPVMPESVANGSERTLEVILSVLDLNKSGRETFELDCKVQDLVRIIAKKYQLPNSDELNVATTYYIKSKALGRVLNGAETLRTAKVPKHDRLAVLRQEIAG